MTRQKALSGYSLLVATVAAGVLAYSGFLIGRSDFDLKWLPYLLILVCINWLCSRQEVYFTDSNAVMMGTIGQIATVLLLPPQLAIVTVALAKGLSELYLLVTGQRRASWRGPVVNTSAMVLAVGTGSMLFSLLHGADLWSSGHFLSADPTQWSQGLLKTLYGFPAVIALGASYHLVDALVVSIAVWFTNEERLASIFAQISMDTLLPEVSLIFVGIVFAVLFRASPLLSLFIVMPVYLSMQSFGAVTRLKHDTIAAVLKMARSIEIRDEGTADHVERLGRSAQELAVALGLTPEHANEIRLAALTHDFGKIEISDSILNKPGPLTAEERLRMQEHPLIGAEFLNSFPAFQKSVDFVKHHHERWDGRGYPHGLKGENISIGARIIAVVDAYDAMRNDRPYRKGLSANEAVERLKAGMGSQFDPNVCAKWIQLLIEDGEYQPAEEHRPMLHLVDSEAG